MHCSCYKSIGTVSRLGNADCLRLELSLASKKNHARQTFLKLCGNLATKDKLVTLLSVLLPKGTGLRLLKSVSSPSSGELGRNQPQSVKLSVPVQCS